MDVRDRVTLACDAGWGGTITGIRGDVADVDFDGGGKGRIKMSDLNPERDEDEREEQAERERARASADKSWPPSTMETKVPEQRGAK